MSVDYDLVGYTLRPNGSQLKFLPNQVVSGNDFGEEDALSIYTSWASDYIVEFKSDNSHYGQGQDPGHMQPTKLSTLNGIAPMCGFLPPGERGRLLFHYFNDTETERRWQDVEQYNDDPTAPRVNVYGFKNWTCTIAGRRYTFREDVGYDMQQPPVVTMVAYWQRNYDTITYTVYGETYCQVCIDNKINRVVYPSHAPVIQPPEGSLKFYGWNCAEGDYLPGVDRSTTVICGTESNPIVCGDGATPIVCKEDDIDYDVPIEAYIVEYKERKFQVVFKYMDDTGTPTEHIEENVPQNKHLPRFHIHNKYEKDGSTFTFKHWLLESGNLTSSLTVLSDLVFVAVYDETTTDYTEEQEHDLPEKGTTVDPIVQSEVDESDLWGCGYHQPYPGEGHTHTGYCTLAGLDPQRYEEHFEELDDCPYVKLLQELYDGELVSKDSLFRETTIMEISDIADLLKALFKVNIDIAHREYFLKIDVPEESNWWYGYNIGDIKPYIVCDANSRQIVCYDSDVDDDIVCIGGKWVSFEPTVQLKFSNLHSDNQPDEDGNLICTTKSRVDMPEIVPVNRELSFEYDNLCI